MVTQVNDSPGVDIDVKYPAETEKQRLFVFSTKKLIIVRAGRRGGKTVGAAQKAVRAFCPPGFKRVLYAAPTSEQVGKFWFEVKQALQPLLDTGVFKCNESEKYIERIGTENRLKAKTAWNADTLRGDFADLLILDEFQLMNEDTWDRVGAPMLADNDGDALFIYTPPSLRAAGVSKARDPRHAAKMFKMAQEDTTGRWLAVHFTSFDNPHISHTALAQLAKDMSKASYRQEIMAEDDEAQLSWLVYRAFNETLCRIPRFEVEPKWPRYVFHDFGTANPAALFVAQNPGTGDFFVEREYLPGAGRSTAEHVIEFKRLTEGQNVIMRVGGSHQEEEIRQGYGAHGWPIQEPKIKTVKAQIDKVIGMMELNKIKVFDDCVNYLEELMNCLWMPDEEGKPTDKIKDEERYHLCASARYGFSNFTPETVINSGPPITRRDKFRF